MGQIMISRRRIVAGLAAGAATFLGTSLLNKQSSNKPTGHTHLTYKDPGYWPNVTLTNHLGQSVNFYDDLIKDKLVIINMMYAQCSDGVCPISTYNLKKVTKALGSAMGKDVHIYSISLDAIHDTPKVLEKYANENNIGPGWQLLTGDYDDIELLRRRLGFFDHDPIVDRDRANHAGVIRIGYEPLKNWLMAPALGNYKSILQVIKHADRKKLLANGGVA